MRVQGCASGHRQINLRSLTSRPDSRRLSHRPRPPAAQPAGNSGGYMNTGVPETGAAECSAPPTPAAGAMAPPAAADKPQQPAPPSDSSASTSTAATAAAAAAAAAAGEDSTDAASSHQAQQRSAGDAAASEYAAVLGGGGDPQAPANLDELLAQLLERQLALAADAGGGDGAAAGTAAGTGAGTGAGGGGAASSRQLAAELLGVQRVPVLDSLDLAGVAKLIASGRARRIIVMCGAGVSVSAGIPDFRTAGTGLYSQLERYGLPEPEAVFSIGFFRKNPKPFHMLAKELFPGNYAPTPAHCFMRLLHDKGLLLRCFTQNIDSLERQAGLPASAIVAAHGNFDSARCIRCGTPHSVEHVKQAVFADEICRCTKCSAYVKPDIVFFGEQLPERFYQRMERDFPACDLLLVMGTSLVVHPFASLVDAVPDDCPRVLINREHVGEAAGSAGGGGLMALLGGFGFGGGGGFVFPPGADSTSSSRNGSSGAYRDVLFLGDADDGVRQLADLLGWRAELEALVEASRASASERSSSGSSGCEGGSEGGGGDVSGGGISGAESRGSRLTASSAAISACDAASEAGAPASSEETSRPPPPSSSSNGPASKSQL